MGTSLRDLNFVLFFIHEEYKEPFSHCDSIFKEIFQTC